MSLIKHVTLQKIVAHDFRYDLCIMWSLIKSCRVHNMKHKYSSLNALVQYMDKKTCLWLSHTHKIMRNGK